MRKLLRLCGAALEIEILCAMADGKRSFTLVLGCPKKGVCSTKAPPIFVLRLCNLNRYVDEFFVNGEVRSDVVGVQRLV